MTDEEYEKMMNGIVPSETGRAIRVADMLHHYRLLEAFSQLKKECVDGGRNAIIFSYGISEKTFRRLFALWLTGDVSYDRIGMCNNQTENLIHANENLVANLRLTFDVKSDFESRIFAGEYNDEGEKGTYMLAIKRQLQGALNGLAEAIRQNLTDKEFYRILELAAHLYCQDPKDEYFVYEFDNIATVVERLKSNDVAKYVGGQSSDSETALFVNEVTNVYSKINKGEK